MIFDNILIFIKCNIYSERLTLGAPWSICFVVLFSQPSLLVLRRGSLARLHGSLAQRSGSPSQPRGQTSQLGPASPPPNKFLNCKNRLKQKLLHLILELLYILRTSCWTKLFRNERIFGIKLVGIWKVFKIQSRGYADKIINALPASAALAAEQSAVSRRAASSRSPPSSCTRRSRSTLLGGTFLGH